MGAWADAVKGINIRPEFQQAAAGASGTGSSGESLPAGEIDTGTGGEGSHAGEHDAPAAAQEDPDAAAAAAAEDGGGDEPPEGLTPEERSANAERRRKSESRTQKRIDDAVTAARESFRQELNQTKNEVISSLGLVDPETGKPITDMSGLETFRRAMNERRINTELEKVGLAPETLREVIDNHPDVLAARQMTQRAQTETARVLDTEAENKLKAELAEIQKYAPEVKSASDLVSLPEYSEIQRFVKAGLTISEAYYTTNRAKILEKERRAGAQQTMNSVNGRQHLQPDAQHGSGGGEIPPEQLKQFAKLYPGLNPTELRKKYERVAGPLNKKG